MDKKAQDIIKATKMAPGAIFPSRAYPLSVGFDLYAMNEYNIMPWHTETIGTGVSLDIKGFGYFALILPRSSMNTKGVLTHVGVIDPDYTGEIKIVISNLFRRELKVEKNQRIAQLVFFKANNNNNIVIPTDSPILPRNKVKELRGDRGFGSSGK